MQAASRERLSGMTTWLQQKLVAHKQNIAALGEVVKDDTAGARSASEGPGEPPLAPPTDSIGSAPMSSRKSRSPPGETGAEAPPVSAASAQGRGRPSSRNAGRALGRSSSRGSAVAPAKAPPLSVAPGTSDSANSSRGRARSRISRGPKPSSDPSPPHGPEEGPKPRSDPPPPSALRTLAEKLTSYRPSAPAGSALRRGALRAAFNAAALVAFVSSCDLVSESMGRRVLKSATPRRELLLKYALTIFAVPSTVIHPGAFAEILTDRYGAKLPLPEIILFALYAFLCILVTTFLQSSVSSSSSFTKAAGKGFLITVSTGIVMCVLLVAVLPSKTPYSAWSPAVQALFRFFAEMSRVMSVYLTHIQLNKEPSTRSAVRWFVLNATYALGRSFARALQDEVLYELQRRAGVPPNFRLYVDMAAKFFNIFSSVGERALRAAGLVLPPDDELLSTAWKVWNAFDEIELAPLERASSNSTQEDRWWRPAAPAASAPLVPVASRNDEGARGVGFADSRS